nr:PREDICTED: homeobox protein CDX-1 isoform X1 [Latimeria chalumnae]|eukprot:XP_005988337.1 PREDICTED: homeobox protein CDX-1 isoform X1 [Latimeria chalumnae]
MYVSYLLDKDNNMYPNSVRHPSLNLNPQNFVPAPPQYSDFAGYHHVPGINTDPHHGQPTGTWGSPYAPTREDWHSYGPGPASTSTNPGQIAFSPPDFNPVQPPGPGLLPPTINSPVSQLSPTAQRRNPYDWMRRTVPANNAGKTRTKDKYRVVYTDHQRLELEKEFHYSRYITIRRKAELAASLGLTERQVNTATPTLKLLSYRHSTYNDFFFFFQILHFFFFFKFILFGGPQGRATQPPHTSVHLLAPPLFGGREPASAEGGLSSAPSLVNSFFPDFRPLPLVLALPSMQFSNREDGMCG